jgi:hypothetical protein
MLNFTFKTVSSCCTDRLNKFFLFVMVHFYKASSHRHRKIFLLIRLNFRFVVPYCNSCDYFRQGTHMYFRQDLMVSMHSNLFQKRTNRELFYWPYHSEDIRLSKQEDIVASQITYNQYTLSLPIAAMQTNSKICSEYAASL